MRDYAEAYRDFSFDALERRVSPDRAARRQRGASLLRSLGGGRQGRAGVRREGLFARERHVRSPARKLGALRQSAAGARRAARRRRRRAAAAHSRIADRRSRHLARRGGLSASVHRLRPRRDREPGHRRGRQPGQAHRHRRGQSGQARRGRRLPAGAAGGSRTDRRRRPSPPLSPRNRADFAPADAARPTIPSSCCSPRARPAARRACAIRCACCSPSRSIMLDGSTCGPDDRFWNVADPGWAYGTALTLSSGRCCSAMPRRSSKAPSPSSAALRVIAGWASPISPRRRPPIAR